MSIAPFKKKNRDELFRVWEDSVRATHHFLSDADIKNLCPVFIEKGIPNNTIYCFFNQTNEIQGFVGVSADEINMLFVASDSIRKGIGSALLNYAVDVLKCRKLDVNEQNLDALAFYKASGFQIVGRSERDGQGNAFPLLHMEL